MREWDPMEAEYLSSKNNYFVSGGDKKCRRYGK